jgi:hypothetical protein
MPMGDGRSRRIITRTGSYRPARERESRGRTEAGRTGIVGGVVHTHQLRKTAGGLYRPSDQATKSSMLRAASSERFAAMRDTPRSWG